MQGVSELYSQVIEILINFLLSDFIEENVWICRLMNSKQTYEKEL